VSKKERGPYRITSEDPPFYRAKGPGVDSVLYLLAPAIACVKDLNTAYLAGKRSRSKGRGK
jgi:hypothetical protein